jgi:elongation factor G
LESIEKRLAGDKAVAIQLPWGEQSEFKGVIDLVKMKAYTFEGEH